ncbi:transmembrane protein 68-like [Oppia nitens]|uniref:transmembrane protein 68-like n=1 Tax=Oppia nitens TaxID=1686743 RepID=UPI0023DBF97E|nr:transmembrane protein 68-like [Oppia nitens]
MAIGHHHNHNHTLATELVISSVDGESAGKSRGQLFVSILMMLWDAHGYYWYGYEVVGWDRIPRTGPALLVYYHGCIAMDYMLLVTKVLFGKHRVIHTVSDNFLFMIPGCRQLMVKLRALQGRPNECIRQLNAGHLLSIAPGGVREGQFGDNRYRLLWNNRQGFARVAREARVPIIPLFTRNLRESFRSVKWCQRLLRPLYEWSRLPLVPFYGGFPVKLTTYVGEPIPYDSGVSVDQLALRTKRAVERLIRENQRIPGNIWDAICDRFY